MAERRYEKCSIYYINTNEDNMLFSHVKVSSFRAKAHLVFHWCLYNKFISLIYLTVTYLLAHSFTFTILYLSIYQFIFHSLINLHQVIKVRLHSYFHTYVYTRHSLTKLLLLGNEVFFFLSIVFHSPQLIFNFSCNPLCIRTLEKARAIKLCHFYDVLMT